MRAMLEGRQVAIEAAARPRRCGGAQPRRAACRLLDGDGLGEVARLVDVQAAAAGDLVREQLQRDDREDRLQHPVDRGDLDRGVGVLDDLLVAGGGERDHVRAAGADLLHVGGELLEHRRVGGDARRRAWTRRAARSGRASSRRRRRRRWRCRRSP